jgi:hypothetical protein
MELESAIRRATRGKSACYENLPPDRAAKLYLRFIVRSDEQLTAFLELEAAICP